MTEPWDKSAQSRILWRLAAGDGAAAAEPDALLLAGYAEGRLDAAAREEAEALLAAHPELAEDVALATAPAAEAEADLARIVARACALVPGTGAEIVPFRRRGASRPDWGAAMRWSALAASFALVSYLGFALGNDASLRLATASSQATIDELFDPPSGFFSVRLDAGST
jgi:hypothetical protein